MFIGVYPNSENLNYIINQNTSVLFVNITGNKKGYNLLKGYYINFYSGVTNELFRIKILYVSVSYGTYNQNGTGNGYSHVAKSK